MGLYTELWCFLHPGGVQWELGEGCAFYKIYLFIYGKVR